MFEEKKLVLQIEEKIDLENSHKQKNSDSNKYISDYECMYITSCVENNRYNNSEFYSSKNHGHIHKKLSEVDAYDPSVGTYLHILFYFNSFLQMK